MSLSLAQRRKTTQHPASNAMARGLPFDAQVTDAASWIWLRCLQSDELLTDVILGTSGRGLETCRQLLKHDATVCFTAQNLDKAETTRKDIVGNGNRGESNANLHVVHMDLSGLESIKKGADSFKAGLNRFDVLINNGMSFPVLPNVKSLQLYFLVVASLDGFVSHSSFALALYIFDIVPSFVTLRILILSKHR